MNQSTGNPAIPSPDRLYMLDLLRGLGALSIIFWHWQHFFMENGVLSADYSAEKLPLAFIFLPLYKYGYLSVDLFFVISGYVFHKLYSETIQSGRIDAFDFFVLRFSRLYPLYFVTLISTIIFQFFYTSNFHHRFVYQHDDLYHFFLSLFLLSGTGLESDFTYNGPSWSISVEIVLYSIFFILNAYWGAVFRRLAAVALLALVGLLMHDFNEKIGRGLFGFFAGAIIFHLVTIVIARGWRVKTLRLSSIALLAVCVITAIELNTTIFRGLIDFYQSNGLPLTSLASKLSQIKNERIVNNLSILVVFPLGVFVAILAEPLLQRFIKKLSIIGDMSYSIYLWHFPCQIIFALIFFMVSSNKFFETWPSLVLFFSVLLPISMFSYYKIEKPLQKFLRVRLYKFGPKPA